MDCQYFVDKYTETFKENIEWKTFLMGSIGDSYTSIKVHHISTKLDCTITFASGVCVEYSQLLKHMYSMVPNARKFNYFVHYCLQEHNGFALLQKDIWNLLIIFYLQACKFLPPIKTIQSLASIPFVGGKKKLFGVFQ